MKKQKKSWLFTALVVLSLVLANFAGARFFTDAIQQTYGTEIPVGDAFEVVMITTAVVGVLRYANRRERHAMNRGGLAFVGTFQDVWVSWILDKFYADFPFLKHMRDLSEYVKNDIINVREIGADPEVLINNNTYPIPTRERDDNNYPIELDKYETTNTAITLKEIDRLDYNKFMTATRQHQRTLMEKAQSKWTHALGALQDSTLTPVLECTGSARTDGTKKATAADFIRLAQAFDNMKTPQSGRVLVLSGDHSADIISEDLSRYKALSDLPVGEALDLFGFKTYKSIFVPKYHKSSGAKLAFGAEATSNDASASIAWHEDQVGYAKGSMHMFHKPKNINTENRREEVGFTMYGIGLPLRNKFLGALFSKAS